jgi:signal transduction histidine kinase
MAQEIKSVLDDVRELSRGLHPAQLARRGLGPSLRALARRSPIPVEVAVEVDERPPPPVETAVYYVVSEALTNAIRYSGASGISVTVGCDGEWLRVTIADNGSGGAEAGAGPGSGLLGLSDRVEALGGRFSLLSPSGSGTRISVELPVTAPVAP